MFTRLKGGISKILRVLEHVPGLARLKFLGRIAGVLGMITDIGISVIQSFSQMDFMILITTVGETLVQVNQGLIADINALQAGAQGQMFWWHTWGIYSKLWFLLFVTGALAGYLKKTHLGGDIAKYQLYFVSFVFIITPVQLLGSIIVEVVQTGKFTMKDLNSLGVWNGLYRVAINTDLWLQPTLEAVQKIPYVSAPDLNSTATTAENASQTI